MMHFSFLVLYNCFINHSWNHVFLDLESGIKFYELGIGSNPGHADILPFIKTEQETGSFGHLELQEGHSYYVTVKVL